MQFCTSVLIEANNKTGNDRTGVGVGKGRAISREWVEIKGAFHVSKGFGDPEMVSQKKNVFVQRVKFV